MARGSNPITGQEFICSLKFKIGFGAHPASYSTGARGSFTGVKLPCSEADDSTSSCGECENERACVSRDGATCHITR